jgi:hypothetical protein
MMQYIHDPEFEADYINEYESEEYIPQNEDVYLSERLATLEDQYIQLLDKTPDQLDNEYIHCLVRDMWQYVDETNFEDHPFFKREAIHLFYKTVNTPAGRKYLIDDIHFLRLCKWSAEEILQLYHVSSDEDGLWDNTKLVINEFLQEADTVLTNLSLI